MKVSLRRLFGRIAAAGVSVLLSKTAMAAPWAEIDHLILGVADLEQGIEQFERLTGVRPVYGGKHPTGTHNALVSLGGRTYLEILAVQPGFSPTPQFPQLPELNELTPVGWALTARDPSLLNEQIAAAGLALSAAKPGSRATPQGSALHWVMFDLLQRAEAAPFFIFWREGSAHPSATSPGGCTLVDWSVAAPQAGIVQGLRALTGPPAVVREAAVTAMSLTLACPKGAVKFDSSAERP